MSPESRSLSVELRVEMGPGARELMRLEGALRRQAAVDALAIYFESMRRSFRAANRALAGVAESLARWRRRGDDPTPDDRLYARRYLRAVARSRRNQPAPEHPFDRFDGARTCPECGGPGVLIRDRLFDGDHYQDEHRCPRCRGVGAIPRPGRLASASRKRRPHGRPR